MHARVSSQVGEMPFLCRFHLICLKKTKEQAKTVENEILASLKSTKSDAFGKEMCSLNASNVQICPSLLKKKCLSVSLCWLKHRKRAAAVSAASSMPDSRANERTVRRKKERTFRLRPLYYQASKQASPPSIPTPDPDTTADREEA
jgi:hypothetical protein